MISREDALERVQSVINEAYSNTSITGPRVVVPSATKETPSFWMVSYVTQKYIETGDELYLFDKNALVGVRKEDGRMAFLGAPLSVEGAQVWADRLERIWDVQTVYCRSELAFYWKGKGGEVRMSLNCMNVPHPALKWRGQHFGMSIHPYKGVVRLHLKSFDERIQEARDFVPIFRRKCWLSGCTVEASMHEKMEWVRGFSREEVEAWKLKM